VAQVTSPLYSESQRMQLRALIRLASDVVSYYWPMRTFVHHNPLHGLEDLRFEDAVQLAEIALGGRLLVMVAVLPQRLFVRVPACMCERGLLTKQQADDAEKLKNRALHLP